MLSSHVAVGMITSSPLAQRPCMLHAYPAGHEASTQNRSHWSPQKPTSQKPQPMPAQPVGQTPAPEDCFRRSTMSVHAITVPGRQLLHESTMHWPCTWAGTVEQQVSAAGSWLAGQ